MEGNFKLVELAEIDGMTMDQWVEKETAKRKTTFWGQEFEIQPVIHPEIFGDGKQLCYLGTIDQRPNYWLIRIDSSIDINQEEFDMEETLLIPLEDAFGQCEEFLEQKDFNSWDKKDEFDNYEHFLSWTEYPKVSWSGGHWGTIVNFVQKEYYKDLFNA